MTQIEWASVPASEILEKQLWENCRISFWNLEDIAIQITNLNFWPKVKLYRFKIDYLVSLHDVFVLETHDRLYHLTNGSLVSENFLEKFPIEINSVSQAIACMHFHCFFEGHYLPNTCFELVEKFDFLDELAIDNIVFSTVQNIRCFGSEDKYKLTGSFISGSSVHWVSVEVPKGAGYKTINISDRRVQSFTKKIGVYDSERWKKTPFDDDNILKKLFETIHLSATGRALLSLIRSQKVEVRLLQHYQRRVDYLHDSNEIMISITHGCNTQEAELIFDLARGMRLFDQECLGQCFSKNQSALDIAITMHGKNLDAIIYGVKVVSEIVNSRETSLAVEQFLSNYELSDFYTAVVSEKSKEHLFDLYWEVYANGKLWFQPVKLFNMR